MGDAVVFIIFVFHKNKNKTNKSHFQCTVHLLFTCHEGKVKENNLVIVNNND